MQHLSRTVSPALPHPCLRALRAAFPQTIPVLAGYFVLGLGYGIYVQSLGLPVWMPMLMGTVVYGGSLEFVLASLLLGAFSPLSAFLMALMIQARHLFYGLAMLERYKGYGWRSFYMIFAMSDETFSITCSATPPEGVDKGWFMFFITLLDQLYWVGSAGLGAALGTVLPFSTEGVDFVMTAMFTVIFLNQWEKDKQHGSALIGLAVPLVCLIVFGSGSFLLPSMAGILELLLALRRPMEKAAGNAGCPEGNNKCSRQTNNFWCGRKAPFCGRCVPPHPRPCRCWRVILCWAWATASMYSRWGCRCGCPCSWARWCTAARWSSYWPAFCWERSRRCRPF